MYVQAGGEEVVVTIPRDGTGHSRDIPSRPAY